MVEGKILVLGLKSRIFWMVNKPHTKSSLFGLKDVLGISNSPPLILTDVPSVADVTFSPLSVESCAPFTGEEVEGLIRLRAQRSHPPVFPVPSLHFLITEGGQEEPPF